MNCQLCGRESNKTEKHHLIPQNKKSDTIIVCDQCGDQIHLLYDNKELATRLNTLEKLKSDDKITRYIKWIKSKPIDKSFSVKKLKRKHR